MLGKTCRRDTVTLLSISAIMLAFAEWQRELERLLKLFSKEGREGREKPVNSSIVD